MTKGWRCPDCGRQFVQKTREHSCSVTLLEAHLSKTGPDVRRAFEAIVSILESAGPFEIEPLKTMVVFRKAASFGGVTFTKARLDLGFFLRRIVPHERMHRIDRMSAVKFAHHIRISTPDEVDEELEAWLREAYDCATE